MAQHDMNIANDTAANVRGDMNNALSALVSQNSGTGAPATTFANMIWYDATNNILKMRNEANDAWIDVLHLDQTNDLAFPAAGRVSLTTLTSGTAATYTVPDNVRQIIVEMVGGGSGGGGVNGIASAVGLAGGGGSGDYTLNVIDVAPGDTFTYTVGSGGAGGGAGDNNGSAGTDTTFSNGGAVSITAVGANTGGGGSTGTTGNQRSAGGNATGTSSGHDLLIRGTNGWRGVVVGGAAAQLGRGATSHLGQESYDTGYNGAGGDARGYGSGGGGAGSTDATNYAGGDGGGGLIKITEIR